VSANNGRAEPLRVGILGGAAIAWRSMAPALHAEPSVRLVAVASRSPERAGRFAARYGCAALTDYDQLLDRVSTPSTCRCRPACTPTGVGGPCWPASTCSSRSR
jgi:hypothetical protein